MTIGEVVPQALFGLAPRRQTRYIVMPYQTDYTGGDCRTVYGILDGMFPRPRWCSLPGEDGEPEVLLWTTQAQAETWLHECADARQREGGPAYYLPFGWYGPREATATVRAAFSPWEEHPPGSPLLRREGGT